MMTSDDDLYEEMFQLSGKPENQTDIQAGHQNQGMEGAMGPSQELLQRGGS